MASGGCASVEFCDLRKQFFFEKKNQKLLRVWARCSRKGRSQNNQKFFASFFSKKKTLLSCPSVANAPVVSILPG
jgi:hypothetical protein